MQKTFKKIALMVCILTFTLLNTLSLTVQANKTNTIWYVAKSGSNTDGTSWAAAYHDLQDALAAASDGDQIWVAAGLYVPGDERTDSFHLVPGVALYGGFAGTESSLDERDWEANLSILSGDIASDDLNDDGNFIAETPDDIQGENSYHVLYADGTTGTPITETTILDGFTVTAGKADDTVTFELFGSALYCKGSVAESECSPTLENLAFYGNFADSGGAIYNNGSRGNSSPNIKNVLFSGNKASDSGGAIYNGSSSGESNPILENVTFYKNSANEKGGAMFNYNCNPILVNVFFSENTAVEYGGAMYNDGHYHHSSNPSLENVTFSKNTADYGGAMYSYGHEGSINPSLVNVLFYKNTATYRGGAMYNYGANGDSSFSILNTTFYGNTAKNGGGIYNFDIGRNTTATMDNIILWGNTAEIEGDQMYSEYSVMEIRNSIIEGGVTDEPNNILYSNGLIDADPLFIDAEAGDLHLQANSPAIDSGRNASISVLTDLDGKQRIFDGDMNGIATVDMGAYEYQPPMKNLFLPMVIR